MVVRKPRNTMTTSPSDNKPQPHFILDNIIQLIHSTISNPFEAEDEIHGCGQAALSILSKRPDACINLAHEKLHAFPYKDVPICWRRLYAEASLWDVLQKLKTQRETGLTDVNTPKEGQNREKSDDVEEHLDNGEEQGDWTADVVRTLDMTLILTGGPRREELIEKIMAGLDKILFPPPTQLPERPSKRQKLEEGHQGQSSLPIDDTIPSAFPISTVSPPPLRFPIPRVHVPSLPAFQAHLSSTTPPTPLIITGSLEHWPAITTRPWNNPSYLLTRTLGGRRLVPIEIGRSYTDTGWSQRILSFRSFLTTYMFAHPPEPASPTSPITTASSPPQQQQQQQQQQTGYLAQHDLFSQVPALRADISIPDYCFSDPPPPTHPVPGPPVAQLDEPLLNAWFGPAGTISPLHTDPYHNVLTQVVGAKYVRLYAPSQGPRLYPRGVGEDGIDMGNTSQVDVGEAMAVFEGEGGGGEELEARRREFEEEFPLFRDAGFVEGVLGPGECLYIPVGWWHYVRSLSPSFSVSFWWN
jgi:hypothetical protein